MITHIRDYLDPNYFEILEGNLQQVGLFQYPTETYVIDPTKTDPSGVFTQEDINSNFRVMFGEVDSIFSVPAVNSTDVQWANSYWDMFSKENFEMQINTWVINNSSGFVFSDYTLVIMKGYVSGDYYTTAFVYPANQDAV